MAYENDYESLLINLKRIDNYSRRLMKGMYRREIENAYMREVIANFIQNSKTISDLERRSLMNALQHDPWQEVEYKFDNIRSAVKTKLGHKTFVGDSDDQ